ncbi:MAG: haloacid dehalogenase type II [Rhodospirillales bacterium]|nr:haloacid dehalogenase type II [Alphaproteobacteria bacterium]MBL6947649.1 haloacid dehalogenase type II [Rhodospirillales bacterium]
MNATDLTGVTALLFDTYGTVVDWRSSVADEGRRLAREKNLPEIDWDAFADAWRAGYFPAMDRIRRGEQPWTTNDTLQRNRLDEIVEEFGLGDIGTGLTDEDKDEFNRVWHRLNPWPDSVAGLSRLKSKFTIGTLSNGSFFLLANMARHSGLPWDCILSADNFHHYKPDPEVYLGAVELFGGRAEKVMMVAAHNYDLKHARSFGMKTAFVARPTEYGPDQKTDLQAEERWDVITDSIENLADALGMDK